MHTPTSTKMGIKPGMRAIFVDAPADAVQAVDLPDLEIKESLRGEFDYIHLFVKNQEDFHDKFPVLKNHLKSTGTLWVSWPKARQLGTDLTLPTVIKIGYDYGLVESKCLSIDAMWSALKFTYPKDGKAYANSYGKLK